MNQLRYLFIAIFLFSINACAKKDEKNISLIKEASQEMEMVSAYKQAYQALEENDPYFAAKKFLEAELLFPQSEWAPRSALMAAYSYYLQNYYAEALFQLERYIKTYPNDKNLSYGYYLMAMCYYETIEDEKRDSEPLIEAKKKFQFILKEYPNTDFALDAKFKLDLINDILASKEIYLGRYYIKKEKWVAAINRFKQVVDYYDTTIYIDEALHRLVELHYRIGLIDEAKKYASVLGYNYQSSKWYDASYSILNKKYKSPLKKNKKEGNFIIRKFKSLFEL